MCSSSTWISSENCSPWGIFVFDAAFAGSRGVHLPNPTQTRVNQIPDQFLSLQGALVAQGSQSVHWHHYGQPAESDDESDC